MRRASSAATCPIGCSTTATTSIGVDDFCDYYDHEVKRSNLASASEHERFTLVEDDLLTTDLDRLLDGIDVVFHQAGQPGVRLSWADGFETYARLNMLATQRLLEAATRHPLRSLRVRIEFVGVRGR